MRNKFIGLVTVALVAVSPNLCFGDEERWSKHMTDAWGAAAKSDWSESSKALQKAVVAGRSLGELDPRHEQSLFELAKCYQTMKLDAQALPLFETLRSIRKKRKSLYVPSEEAILLAYSQSLKKQKGAKGLVAIQDRLEDLRAAKSRSIDPVKFAESARGSRFRYGETAQHRQITVDQWLARGGVKATPSKVKARMLSPFVVSLLSALETGDVDTRSLAVCLLTRLGPQAAPSYFFLKDREKKEESYYVKRLISRALSKIPEPPAATDVGEIIANSLRSENPMIRRHAAHLIGTLDGTSTLITPELVMTLNDPEESVVEVAIHSLSRICKKKKENWKIVGPEFQKIISGSDCHLATEVALEWSKQPKSGPIGREQLESRIISLFRNPEQSRKEELLKALKDTRPWGEKSRALNLSLLNSEEPLLRRLAFQSLRAAPLQVPAKVKLFATLEVTKELEPELRRLLVNLGNNVVPAMITLLQSENLAQQARAKAVLNQVTISGKNTLKLLTHQHPELRIWAATKVESLGEMPIFPDSTKILEVSLKDESPIVRASAARALGLTCTKTPLSTKRGLMKALEDKNGLVRRRAACSLGLIGKNDPGVLEALKAHKKDSSRIVRIEVAKAIAKLSQ